MVVKNLTSIQGSTVAESMLDLLTKISQEIRSFDNVTLVEVYEPTTNVKRYLYELDDFEDDYLFITNNNSSSLMIYYGFISKTDSHGSTNRISVSTTTKTISTRVYGVDLYLLSNNNILKGFSVNATSNLSMNYIIFTIEENEPYVLYKNGSNVGVYKSTNSPIMKYLYLSYPYASTSGVAIKRKALVQEGANISGLYMIFENVIVFSNTEFNSNTNKCIMVDGKKYRQVYDKGIFVEDVDF